MGAGRIAFQVHRPVRAFQSYYKGSKGVAPPIIVTETFWNPPGEQHKGNEHLGATFSAPTLLGTMLSMADLTQSPQTLKSPFTVTA